MTTDPAPEQPMSAAMRVLAICHMYDTIEALDAHSLQSVHAFFRPDTPVSWTTPKQRAPVPHTGTVVQYTGETVLTTVLEVRHDTTGRLHKVPLKRALLGLVEHTYPDD